MKKRNPVVIGFAVAALFLTAVAAWWFVSPLFINKMVDEPFPVVRGEGETAVADINDMAMDDMDNMAMEKEEMMDDMAMDDTDDMAVEKEEMMDDMAMDTMAMDDTDMEDMDDMAEDAPILLKEGMFRDGGSSYSGSGQAAVYRLPDGSHILRLEEFSVTNGPDLYVLLANHPDPATSTALHSQATIELERLKGNQGSQNYLIPAGIDISSLGSAVIYCKAFSVIFSVAPFKQ
jgi:hypothetical protein